MLRQHDPFRDFGQISQIELIEEFSGRRGISGVSQDFVEEEDGGFNGLFGDFVEGLILECGKMTRENLAVNVFDG